MTASMKLYLKGKIKYRKKQSFWSGCIHYLTPLSHRAFKISCSRIQNTVLKHFYLLHFFFFSATDTVGSLEMQEIILLTHYKTLAPLHF